MRRARPFILTADGARLAIKATPRARRTILEAVADDAEGRPVLKLRLAAPPVEGAANAALIAFLATKLDVPRRAVAIVSGANARHKQVSISGDPETLAARLSAWIDEAERGGDPGVIRTRDHSLRRRMLYPTELRGRPEKRYAAPRPNCNRQASADCIVTGSG
jgi:uncharacterized protein (TIGR00251 family)